MLKNGRLRSWARAKARVQSIPSHASGRKHSHLDFGTSSFRRGRIVHLVTQHITTQPVSTMASAVEHTSETPMEKGSSEAHIESTKHVHTIENLPNPDAGLSEEERAIHVQSPP